MTWSCSGPFTKMAALAMKDDAPPSPLDDEQPAASVHAIMAATLFTTTPFSLQRAAGTDAAAVGAAVQRAACVGARVIVERARQRLRRERAHLGGEIGT